MHIYWVHRLCMNKIWTSIQTENSSALKNAVMGMMFQVLVKQWSMIREVQFQLFDFESFITHQKTADNTNTVTIILSFSLSHFLSRAL